MARRSEREPWDPDRREEQAQRVRDGLGLSHDGGHVHQQPGAAHCPIRQISTDRNRVHSGQSIRDSLVGDFAQDRFALSLLTHARPPPQHQHAVREPLQHWQCDFLLWALCPVGIIRTLLAGKPKKVTSFYRSVRAWRAPRFARARQSLIRGHPLRASLFAPGLLTHRNFLPSCTARLWEIENGCSEDILLIAIVMEGHHAPASARIRSDSDFDWRVAISRTGQSALSAGPVGLAQD